MKILFLIFSIERNNRFQGRLDINFSLFLRFLSKTHLMDKAKIDYFFLTSGKSFQYMMNLI